ncbi:hypothetical protein AB6A40_008141 [Gnathostoma spinigerum]|uniref:Protoheme IX farnesyltransferase, mitochondrial n=1 Tax=Gnathostoma spinigerum TaxID=75299 RepID=A0ABD6EQK2_9BILA
MLLLPLCRWLRSGRIPGSRRFAAFTPKSVSVDFDGSVTMSVDKKDISKKGKGRVVLSSGRGVPRLLIEPVPADQWYVMKPRGLLESYLQLSKSRLTLLIASTAVGGYVLSPLPISISSLFACAAGTALFSASANTFNHVLESPYDAQMKRTQHRLLVVQRFTPLHACTFAQVLALMGFGVLWFGCNPFPALLGALNAVLYAGVYTPMKRYNMGCTWVGAAVGAVPPLMGYSAATGTVDISACVMSAILFCWQFPHFNALSWNHRADYSRAGYRVMCVIDPHLCRLSSLRHSFALVFLCSVAAPMSCLTSWSFAVDCLPVNAILLYLTYRFYNVTDAKTARNLFYYSLLYLPLIMTLMILSNYGQSKEKAGFS